jgi:hypothetical protein
VVFSWASQGQFDKKKILCFKERGIYKIVPFFFICLITIFIYTHAYITYVHARELWRDQVCLFFKQRMFTYEFNQELQLGKD